MEIEKFIYYLKKLLPEDQIIEKSEYFVLPTVCHNSNHKEASHKLYLYKNPDSTPLFHCYTECNQTFNIYQLIQKYYSLRGQEITFRDAYLIFHGVEYSREENFQPQEIKYEKKFKNPLSIELPEHSSNPLDMFHLDELHPWHLEGVDLSILEEFNSGYSKSLQQVSIPHYDWRGRLIGIRVRNFDPLKIEHFKYMPLHVNNMYYSHPLSLNFYGIFESQTEIKKKKKVYLYESEKSVLHHKWIFNENLALAICGKNISKWHSDMLVHFLGVNEVIVGFDKEYQNYSEAFDYVKKIENQTTYLRQFANVGILIDDKDVLKLKQSPVDEAKSNFQNLKIWWVE